MSARDRETIEALARVAAALDGAVLGLGTAALAVASLAKYLAASGALRRIAEAPAVAIPDVRYSLLAGLGEGESRLAVLRGFVRSPPGGTFLIPPGSREHCVVTRHTQTVSSRFLLSCVTP
jgi:E3 ubiquitin-protein ligase MUL1